MSKKPSDLKIVFFGTSRVSRIVLEELQKAGFSPELVPENFTKEELREKNPDLFLVAAYGRILFKEIIDIPKHGSLNVHPSLLPKLRGSSPIQNTILENLEPGVTIIKMDEKIDHGPILAQEKVEIAPFPDHYAIVEAKLAQAGGSLLSRILIDYVEEKITPVLQDDSEATYTQKILTNDALIDLNDNALINMRKVLAYSTEPGAYLMFTGKAGSEIRVKVLDATLKDEKFIPARVIPAGKKEMTWEEFLRGNA